MDVLEDDKKSLKKWLTHKRNKHNQTVARQIQQVQDEQARLRDLEEERNAQRIARSIAAANKKEDSPWMAKAAETRNRLTDQKRASAERWNRFAGTMDGGGRGL